MQPDVAAGLGREWLVCHTHFADAPTVGPHHDGPLVVAHAQHLHRQRRGHLGPDRRDQRHAAHDGRLLDRYQGLAVGRRLQLRQTGQHEREMRQPGARVVALQLHLEGAHAYRGGQCLELESGRPEHGGCVAQRLGQPVVVGRQGAQAVGQCVLGPGQAAGHLLG